MSNQTTRPQIQIIDALTADELIRDMNDEELAAHLELQAEIEAQNAELLAKVTARQSALAKLADLGLTAEEIAAL
jgi:DNA-binding NarL/FixJ family response regulator